MNPAQRILWWFALVVELLLLQQGGGVLGPPPPFACDGLHVLIVEDKPNRGSLPLSQQQIITSTGDDSLKVWMGENGVALRIIDKDNTPTIDEQWVRDAFAVEHPAPPYIVASNGHNGTPGAIPLPLTTAETVALLAPLGSKK